MRFHMRSVKSFFIKAFIQNFSLKIIAAIIALTLFILVAGESVQISKRIKIEYSLPEKTIIANELPYEFELVLSGSKTAIGFVSGQDYIYRVNLTNAQPGLSIIRINPRELNFPREIIVLSISPATLYPRLERVSEPSSKPLTPFKNKNKK